MNKKKKRPTVYYSIPKPKEQKKYFLSKEEELRKMKIRIKEKEGLLEANQNLLDDTIHEIRKINNQIKATLLNLTRQIDSLVFDNPDAERSITNTLKTLDANASLLSIRMNAYNLLLNPSSTDEELITTMGIYGKIEKVYKCLYASRNAKRLNIILRGNTEKVCRLCDSIELAFFIIIENAIKYSPDGEDIFIIFAENERFLKVDFINLAICPKTNELNHLKERGFRSEYARRSHIAGSGLGLFLFDKICLANHVKYEIKIMNDIRVINDKKYSSFEVSMYFV